MSRMWLYLVIFFFSFLELCTGVPLRRIARERGNRPGSYFYHIGDGFQYHRERRRNGHQYFRCVVSQCYGRAMYDFRDGFVHMNDHNHGPDADYPDVMALRHRILDRCRNLDYASSERIMDEERQRFRQSVRVRVTMQNMRDPMARARQSNYPNLPRTLRQLTDILSNDLHRVLSITRDGEDCLYAGSVTARDGSHHVLFISRRLRQHLIEMSVWFSDGTFWAAPRTPRTHQIFTIVTVWDHTVIPVAWVLMERRTQDGYEAVLRLLQLRLLEEGAELQLTRVITDFERGQQNAWQTVFPHITLQGCLWHACRAFINYAVKELHLLRWMRAVPHIHIIIRLCCALPMLPSRLMRRGLILITREAREQGNFLYDLLRPFLQYIFNNWVRDRRGREILSVYRSIFRTNNACESCNSRLNSYTGNAHPNIFSLLSVLRRIESQSYDTVISLRMGGRPSRRRKAKSVRNDRRIRNLERDLRNPPGPLDAAISRFLHAASHLLDNVIEAIVGDDAEQPRN